MVIQGKYKDETKMYLCYFKFGCDGLSGLTQFNQEVDADHYKDDGKCLASHLIILQIVCVIPQLRLELILHLNSSCQG